MRPPMVVDMYSRVLLFFICFVLSHLVIFPLLVVPPIVSSIIEEKCFFFGLRLNTTGEQVLDLKILDETPVSD